MLAALSVLQSHVKSTSLGFVSEESQQEAAGKSAKGSDCKGQNGQTGKKMKSSNHLENTRGWLGAGDLLSNSFEGLASDCCCACTAATQGVEIG